MNKNILTKQLALYNIEITPARVEILDLIRSLADIEFTRGEIIAQVEKKNPSITPAVVGSTLRLFKARKLIQEVQELKIIGDVEGRKRGRPETKFIYQDENSPENSSSELAEPFVLYSRRAA